MWYSHMQFAAAYLVSSRLTPARAISPPASSMMRASVSLTISYFRARSLMAGVAATVSARRAGPMASTSPSVTAKVPSEPVAAADPPSPSRPASIGTDFKMLAVPATESAVNVSVREGAGSSRGLRHSEPAQMRSRAG